MSYLIHGRGHNVQDAPKKKKRCHQNYQHPFVLMFFWTASIQIRELINFPLLPSEATQKENHVHPKFMKKKYPRSWGKVNQWYRGYVSSQQGTISIDSSKKTMSSTPGPTYVWLLLHVRDPFLGGRLVGIRVWSSNRFVGLWAYSKVMKNLGCKMEMFQNWTQLKQCYLNVFQLEFVDDL